MQKVIANYRRFRILLAYTRKRFGVRRSRVRFTPYRPARRTPLRSTLHQSAPRLFPVDGNVTLPALLCRVAFNGDHQFAFVGKVKASSPSSSQTPRTAGLTGSAALKFQYRNRRLPRTHELPRSPTTGGITQRFHAGNVTQRLNSGVSTAQSLTSSPSSPSCSRG